MRDKIMTASQYLLQFITTFWKSLVLILTPIVCALVFLNPDDKQAMKCGYVLLIMALYWVTEVLPVPVTALIPVALFPLLGVMSTGAVTVNYMKSVNFLFMGGLIMALAVENVGLHKRIALRLLLFIGTKPAFIMLAFMLTTAFLSMWISNTAATAMMIPIVEAVSATLDDNSQARPTDSNKMSRFQMLLLSVAYSANIGGTGVITGSPPNFVLPGRLTSLFGADHPLSFFNWMLFSVPLMVVNLLLSFFWLSFIFYRNLNGATPASDRPPTELEASETTDGNGNDPTHIRDVIQAQYEELGSWKSMEMTVAICFAFLISFWFFRDPKAIPGWASLFPYEDVVISDATMTVFMVLVVFALPREFHFWPFQSISTPPKSSEGILEWRGANGVQKRLQWGVILLLGGGFALSDACEKSGLSNWVADRLATILTHPLLSSLIISAITAFITEFASNTATANILVPILVNTSKDLCLNPVYLGMSATLSCSYAFMLPAATAPNALAQGIGGIRITDMMKIGFVLNVICVASTVLMVNTYGRLVFDFSDPLPNWLTSNPDRGFAHCLNKTVSLT